MWLTTNIKICPSEYIFQILKLVVLDGRSLHKLPNLAPPLTVTARISVKAQKYEGMQIEVS